MFDRGNKKTFFGLVTMMCKRRRFLSLTPMKYILWIPSFIPFPKVR